MAANGMSCVATVSGSTLTNSARGPLSARGVGLLDGASPAQHVELGEPSGAAGRGEEFVRAGQRTVGGAAGEGLQADDVASDEVDDRLVDGLDRALGEQSVERGVLVHVLVGHGRSFRRRVATDGTATPP